MLLEQEINPPMPLIPALDKELVRKEIEAIQSFQIIEKANYQIFLINARVVQKICHRNTFSHRSVNFWP